MAKADPMVRDGGDVSARIECQSGYLAITIDGKPRIFEPGDIAVVDPLKHSIAIRAAGADEYEHQECTENADWIRGGIHRVEVSGMPLMVRIMDGAHVHAQKFVPKNCHLCVPEDGPLDLSFRPATSQEIASQECVANG